MQKKTQFLKWGRMAAVLLGVVALALALNVQSAKAAGTPPETCQLTWLGGGIPLDTSTASAGAQKSLQGVTLTRCTNQSLIDSCYLVPGPGDTLLDYQNIPESQDLIKELNDEGLSLSCLYKDEDGPFTNGWTGTIGQIGDQVRCPEKDAGDNGFFTIHSADSNAWYCFANAGSMHRYIGKVDAVCPGDNAGSLMMDVGGHYREIFFPRSANNRGCYNPAGQVWDSTKGIYPVGKNMTRIMIQ